jgi:hypothetical protein
VSGIKQNEWTAPENNMSEIIETLSNKFQIGFRILPGKPRRVSSRDDLNNPERRMRRFEREIPDWSLFDIR